MKITLTLPKWGFGSPSRLGSPQGLSKLQSSITRFKTPHIGVLFMSLKSYRSVNVKKGLARAIWTSVAQVMAKRKAKSQTNSLNPDY